MEPFLKKNLLIAAIIGTFFGPTPLTPRVPEEENRTEKRAGAYSLYLEATYLQQKGKVKEAISRFSELEKIIACPAVYGPYLQALFEAEQYKKMIVLYAQHKKDIHSLFEKNHLLQASVAQAHLATNQKQKAQALFTSLLKDHGDDAQTCYFIVVGYFKTHHVEAATKLLQRCLTNQALQPKHYLFNFLLSKAYLEQNKPTEALVCVEKSIAQFPKFDRGWLFKAVLQEQQGRISEAITGYKKFLDLAGRDKSIEKQLIQLLFNQQRFAEAADYLKKLSADCPEYCFDLALIQAKNGEYATALSNINKVLEATPDLEKAKLLRIEVLLNGGNTEEALVSLKKWILAEPHNLGALHTLLLLRQGNVPAKKLIEVLQEAHTSHPKNLGVTAALADLTCETGNVGDATALYREAIANTSDKKMRGKIYFQICHLLLDQKNYSALESTFEEIQQAGCTYHALQNLQAYYYAQTHKKLAEARHLVDEALRARPESAAYLDTQDLIAKQMHRGSEPEAKTARQKEHLFAQKHRKKESEHHAPQPWQKTKFNSLHSRR